MWEGVQTVGVPARRAGDGRNHKTCKPQGHWTPKGAFLAPNPRIRRPSRSQTPMRTIAAAVAWAQDRHVFKGQLPWQGCPGVGTFHPPQPPGHLRWGASLSRATRGALTAETRGVLKEPNFFFAKDRPHGPPTANRQPPLTTNHQPLTTTNRHQPPPTANRQSPPTMVEHISYTRSFRKTAILEQPPPPPV